MTKRLALTPAVGLFAGLSVVSYGAVSMLLIGVPGMSGVHSTRQASSNPCTSGAPASPAAAAATKALTRPAAHTGARAQHPAGMPELLAYAVSQSTAPLPSSQPSASASAPPLPQPALAHAEPQRLRHACPGQMMFPS